MADYGSSDISTTALGTNQFPISEVYVPNDALRALEGGPVSTDGSGKKSSPASMYVKDGGDTAQGTTTDAAYSGSGAATVIALLKKLVAELAASLTVAGTITEANSAAILTDTAAIQASVAHIPALGQAFASMSVPVVLTAAQQTALTPPSAIAGYALEAGHLSAIDTSTSASKTDLDALNTVHGAVSDAAWSGSGNGSIVAILKKLEAVLAATLVVSGSVSISNFPGTQPVSGTFWQTTQPISGSVSVSNFPATQPVSGTFWQATQPVSAASLPLPTGAATLAKQPALGTAGTASTDVLSVQGIASMTPLKTDGSGVTQPVSGVFWQATQPANITQVSGASVGTANPLPTSLIVGGAVVSAGNPMPMGPMGQATMVNSLSVAIASNQSAVPVSGTFWQATQPVSGTVTMNAGAGTMNVSQLASGSVSGTLQSAVGATGNGATLNVLGMATTVFVVSGTFVGTVTFEGTADGSNWGTITTSGGGVLGNTATAPGNFGASVAGLQAVRARVSAYTSGAITVTAEAVPVSSSTHTINVAQIGGTAMALGQTVKASSVPVTLASDQPAVPVSGTFWQATQPVSGSVSVSNFPATQPVSGTFWQATQPVSGTVSVNALPAGSALIGNVELVDGAGTNKATISAGGALKVDNSAVTQPVSGTFWQTTQPVSQATAANLNATATIQAVTGTALTVGNNALPVLMSAATGYVAAWGTNPAALTSSTDYSFKWGASGTTVVNHIMLFNGTASGLNWDLDVAATAGSPLLAAGQTVFLDVQTTVLHLFQASTAAVNGTSGSNVVVRAWL